MGVTSAKMVAGPVGVPPLPFSLSQRCLSLWRLRLWSRHERVPVKTSLQSDKSCFCHHPYTTNFQPSPAQRTCARVDQRRQTLEVVSSRALAFLALLPMEEGQSQSQKTESGLWSLGENVSLFSYLSVICRFDTTVPQSAPDFEGDRA